MVGSGVRLYTACEIASMMCLLFDGAGVVTIEDTTCVEDGAQVMHERTVLSEYHTMSCRTGAVPCFQPLFHSMYTEMHVLLVLVK